MTTKRSLALAGIALFALLVGLAVFRRAPASGAAAGGDASSATANRESGVITSDVKHTVAQSATPPVGDADNADEAKGTDEDTSEATTAEDAFDAVVDRWMEPQPDGVTMKDVEAFRVAFGRVPSDARDACLQRALNLIPDENALLLAGILLDKTQGRETIEAVFNDVLNRDEQVKLPLLKSIHKDRAHPCWADAAWILDVTDTTEPTTAN